MSSKVGNISIVGGGLVGSVLAIYLAKRGYLVDMFEIRGDIRISEYDSGRSINLALSNRGWWPLKELGIDKEVESLIIPMQGRMMHSTDGELTFQKYGKEGEAINSVSRGGLNTLLLNTAEECGVKIHFNHKCKGVKFKAGKLIFNHNGELINHHADIIIGCDGAYSSVRKSMQRQDRFNYSQYYLEHGYKELTIPAGNDNSFLIEKNALHIWPRGSYMLIALPNLDGSFTCTLFLPFEGSPSFETLETKEDIESFFESKFPDALELMPDLTEEFLRNPTSSLLTTKSYPWVIERTVLLGDSSHAIVPFYGQGMNSGFEDCRVLNDLLNQHNDNWGVVLDAFQKLRKPDADAISELALSNFIEMRDLVANDRFLIRKKIEAKLHQKYPDKWVPLYSMVTFNEKMRYSDALAKGKQQKAIMDKVMNGENILEEWEQLDLQSIVDQLDI